jgi:hypothetical protein
MTTVFHSDEATASFREHAEASSTLHFDALPPEAVAGTTNDVVIAARNIARRAGPLRVDTAYDAAQRRLSLLINGSLRAVAFLLDARSERGEPLIAMRNEVSTTARVDGIDRPFANSIATHLVVAAQNHPQHDVPLKFATPYDEQQSRLELSVTGSAFATTYLLGIIAVRLEQRLQRA